MYRKNFSRNRFGSQGSNGSSFGRNKRSFYFRKKRNNRQNDRIDISKFVQKAKVTNQETETVTSTFSDFGFSQMVNENLQSRNYIKPTPIQDKSIKHILEGRDLIGLANTGTGKTAAFLLPLIEKVNKDRRQNVLIVAPTRELAQQIEREFRNFSDRMRIFSATCVGGAPIYKQISNLNRRPNFVIGTPGRLHDLAEREVIKFSRFQNIVIDEFDRMLDMGFIDDIKQILVQMPEQRQSLFFSATMPDKIRTIINQFSKNPVTIAVKTGTSENVDQDIVKVGNKDKKFDYLQEILLKPEVNKSLIFVETKLEVERVTKKLIEVGFKANCIHGDKRQSQRQTALKLFKNSYINVLVATDVAARGLDIKDISHVINYTLPHTYEDYTHRIGRTGRAGKKGYALTFV